MLRAVLFAITLATVQVAHAHEPPLVRELVFRQGAGPVLVTNRGLVLGDGERGPFHLACAAAMSIGIGARYDVLATSDDVLYVGTSNGLLRSSDGGCSFEPVARFDALLVSALTQAPDDRATFYVAAYDAMRGGLFVTHDAGASFTQLLPASDSEFANDVRIAPSEPARMYVAGETFGSAESTLYLDRSDDAGASFTRVPITLLPSEGDFELLDVAPDDPDLLLARAVDDDAMAMMDRLLVSRDGGASWSSPLTVKTLKSARFGGSSASVWVTGYEGAWRSMDGAQSFEQVPNATRMSFAFEHAGSAWLCGYYDGATDGIGVLGSSGALEPYFEFSEVDTQVSCSEGAATLSACVTQWHDWQNEILYGLVDGGVPDGGVIDASVDAGTSTGDAAMPSGDAAIDTSGQRAERGDAGGCTLAAARAQGSRTPGAWLIVAALGFAVTRARRARRVR